MMVMLIYTLAVTSVPPVYATSQLDEGILCIFSTGKARLWWDILFLCWKETGLVFQSSKVPSKGNSLMSCCSNCFDDRHWDACICLWQLTGGLLFLVLSIQVARLLAYCVVFCSLAELLFSFCRRSVLAFFADGWCHHWQGDVINGYHLGFKSPLRYLPLFMV